jgi:membrane-bound lytic murein transglycosylase MltF
LSSSYAESLEALNTRLAGEGKPPVKINPVNENLETEDILQMVDAGLIGITISDSDLAHFWSQILERIRIHDDLSIASGRQLAWAVREDSPELRKQLNAFVKTVRAGSEIGNVLLARYLKKTDHVRDSLADSDRKRFDDVRKTFETYAPRYDLDTLLMIAQGYQESGLDQDKKSRVGAIGIMQVLPTTARDKAVAIPDIHIAENNVHAGIKYVRFLADRYFADPAIDSLNRTLFALAAYNAGPNRIRQLRGQAAQAGLDPTVWFGSVEYVVARRVGREPVTYVSNIFKYYVAYQASEALLRARKGARDDAAE